MKKYEKHLQRMLQNADMETVEQIAAQFPAADDAAKERIYQGILEKQRIQPCSFMEEPEHVPSITRRHCRSIWAAAACLLICGGIVGGAAMHRPMPAQQETEATAAASGPTEGETQVRAETPETQTAPAAAVSTEAAEHVTEVPAETRTETAVVTVAAEEIVQTAMSEAAEPSETAVQETTFIPAVCETQPTEAWTETMQTDVQETVQTDVQETVRTTEQTETVQKTFEFISLADNLPDVSGFVFTPFESEWGEKCKVETADTANRKYALHKVYEPTILPEGWEFRSKHDPNGIYDDNTIDMFMNDIWYKMISGPDGGEPLTSFYMIYEQHTQAQEILCKQASENAENQSLYACAETTVNGNPAFIYRQDHPNVNQTRSVWYTLYWQQDGYLFSIYTGQIPESYLPELIRMAESVQPIE
ncbi:MAG: DUF4367 domain-containing protein [Oscillospiraceae bacterium]|nr:DUF4367 domain-containing protein [Oscillospiraceae bacterium]